MLKKIKFDEKFHGDYENNEEVEIDIELKKGDDDLRTCPICLIKYE